MIISYILVMNSTNIYKSIRLNYLYYYFILYILFNYLILAICNYTNIIIIR